MIVTQGCTYGAGLAGATAGGGSKSLWEIERKTVAPSRVKIRKFERPPVFWDPIFDHFDWMRDGKEIPKIHTSQKPVNLLKRLIEIFTDPGDVIIDPCAGSGSTLRAARELGRHSYGFEVSKDFYTKACEQMLGQRKENQHHE